MATVSVRYFVNDVDEAIDFFTRHLGFREEMHPAPSFAMLSRSDLRLVLSAPGGGPGGGQAMSDGTLPSPGGWNRFSLEVENLDELVERLRAHGAHFRNEVVTGVGASRSSSRTHQATRSSFSNRPSQKPGWSVHPLSTTCRWA